MTQPTGGTFPKYSFPKYSFPTLTWPVAFTALIPIRYLTVQARDITFAVQERQTTLHPQARNVSFEVEDL